MSGTDENQNIQVTNDGATILRSIGVDNPAAKVLVGKYNQYFIIMFVIITFYCYYCLFQTFL